MIQVTSIPDAAIAEDVVRIFTVQFLTKIGMALPCDFRFPLAATLFSCTSGFKSQNVRLSCWVTEEVSFHHEHLSALLLFIATCPAFIFSTRLIL